MGRSLRRLLYILMRRLGRSLLEMLRLLIVLRMLGTKVIHIMLGVVMLVMVAMVLGRMQVMDHLLLVVTTWLGLWLRMLLSKLDLNHPTRCGIVDHMNPRPRVVILWARWVVQRGLLVPRVGGGVVRLGRVPSMMLSGVGRSGLRGGVV